MGRVKLIPVEMLSDVVEAVNDRLENLRDLKESDLLEGESVTEVSDDITRLESILEVLES